MGIRKAGEEVTPELYQNIWKHLKSDGIPDQAANQMAAEMITHDDFEGPVAEYQKYEDIYAFDFYSMEWQGIWQEMKRVLLFWIDHGVKIFRVDNPHQIPT